MSIFWIYQARIDFDHFSGLVYSFEEIRFKKDSFGGHDYRIIQPMATKVQAPEGYKLKKVKIAEANGRGDIPVYDNQWMLFDPVQTSIGAGSGKVYLRAARVAEIMRQNYSPFVEIERKSG